MATVRITREIRSYVKDRFEMLYRDRIKRKAEELQHLNIGNACYQHYIPTEYRELAQQLNTDPDGLWVDTVHNIAVKMTYIKDDEARTATTVGFTVPLEPPMPLPLRMRGYGTRFELRESMAPYEHAKKVYLELDAMHKERDKLIEQIVDGVLSKCSTLRQVLELWPTAMDFMPDDAKHRHATKTEKRQPSAEELSIDNDVKISLMKARMLAAGG